MLGARTAEVNGPRSHFMAILMWGDWWSMGFWLLASKSWDNPKIDMGGSRHTLSFLCPKSFVLSASASLIWYPDGQDMLFSMTGLTERHTFQLSPIFIRTCENLHPFHPFRATLIPCHPAKVWIQRPCVWDGNGRCSCGPLRGIGL